MVPQIIPDQLNSAANLHPYLGGSSPKKSHTVMHSRMPSKASQETIAPVFDCLFCADSFVVSNKLSKDSLSEKYSHPYIEMKAAEMYYLSRKKLSIPHSGGVLSIKTS